MKTLGFKVKERTTYRIDDLTDLNKLINTFSKNKKRQLQKALALHADTQMTAEEFYQFHTDCLEQRGKKISYTREDFLVLYQKATRQQQGVILSVRDQQQEPLAAVFLVWDKRTLYYLIPCFSEDKKETGASALLAWEAIKQAEARQLQFDFEGSMNRGIANHYKQFASTPTAYFAVRKYYRPMFALFKLFYSLKK